MVDLSLNCVVQNATLEVEYKLSNKGTAPLIAFDGATGKGSPLPDLSADLYIGSAGDEVRMFRVVPKTPTNLTVESLPVPNVSETLPGKTRTVKFQVPVPVRERSEWTPDSPKATYTERTVHIVSLVIGYFWKTSDTVLKPFPENPSVFRLESRLPPEQRIRATQRAAVPVLVRTDAAFRRPE
jgi:hypothetical protein